MVRRESIPVLRKKLEVAQLKRKMEIERTSIQKQLRDIKTEKSRRIGRLFLRGAKLTGRGIAKGLEGLGAVGRNIEAKQRASERKVVATVRTRKVKPTPPKKLRKIRRKIRRLK